MEKTILISLPIEDLETVIINCVNSCLKHNKQDNNPKQTDGFKYIPIQDIFKKRICSKPTFYSHLRAGKFTLYKFGNKSFVDAIEFEKAFHGVKLGN